MQSYLTLEELHAQIISCTACPRLVEYRQEVARRKKREFHEWNYWGRPGPGFGDPQAKLLIIGLAPAAHGANRTGRMFTGDSSGDWLIGALYRAGLANQPTSHHRDDGLLLQNVYLTAVVRCAPPDNRPTRDELTRCLAFLGCELALLSPVRVVLTLGRVAFDGYQELLRRQGHKFTPLTFRHGGIYDLGPALPTLVASYHPSRRNTQTGLLTAGMLDAVISTALTLAG